jgi:hypothetical protein
MKVSELEGALLDYWVAKADGVDVHIDKTLHRCFIPSPTDPQWDTDYLPSQRWEEGGEIIEREKLISSYFNDRWWFWNEKTPMISGPSPLVAAMRAYVHSVYGQEVADE